MHVGKRNNKRKRIRSRDIASWLSGTGDLILDYESDKTYKVVKTVSDVSLTVEQVVDEFSINFEVEPYQYGSFQIFSVDNPTSVVITNNGNTEADTIISVTGTGDVYYNMRNSVFYFGRDERKVEHGQQENVGLHRCISK